jgi:hypothetical protein
MSWPTTSARTRISAPGPGASGVYVTDAIRSGPAYRSDDWDATAVTMTTSEETIATVASNRAGAFRPMRALGTPVFAT